MKKNIAIAIDGPSGAGKSTIARAAAQKFGFIYVDTGAIYRTLGLACLRRGINMRDEAAVCAALPGIEIKIEYGEDGLQHMLLDGEDVTGEIRTPAASVAASDVSALPGVRAHLLEMQRDFARRASVVMDGRDIGTAVLPRAEIKIFLTASVDDRARRRYEELLSRGQEVSFEEVMRDMKYRDEQDSTRAAAPLKPARDAVIFDTTGNTLEESISQITAKINSMIEALS